MKKSIQKEALLFQGKDKWHSNAIDGKQITMHDGPNGIRIEIDDSLGFPQSKPSIGYPTESLIGCSFDKQLLKEYGNILAEECIQTNTDILLGPGINHKRSPLGGRNFEYFSEEPILSGELASCYINGVQEKGIGVSLKHFATNCREQGRMVYDSVIDERTLHELYLKQFEIAVRQSHPWTIMNAYNKLNGIHCTEHQALMDEARRWGFDGAFISDWGAVYDPIASLKTGLNLEMPGGNIGADKLVCNAIQKKVLDESVLHRSNQYLRKLAHLCGNYQSQSFDRQTHLNFAQKAAEESIVLLKNEQQILPLKKEDSILLVGPLAKFPRFQGAGSSGVTSSSIDNLYSSMKKETTNLNYVQGYHLKNEDVDDDLCKETILQARNYDKIIVVVGLPEGKEIEGTDRKKLSLPKNQIDIIQKIKQVNSNIIIIIQTGSPVLLPFKNDVQAIVLTYLAGSRSGQATTSILYGNRIPCGKLAETWPCKETDVPAYNWFSNDTYETQYRETIFSGYRYYDTFDISTEYDFGYGASYTKFEYSDFEIELKDENLIGSITVKNIGAYDAKEIIQVYMSVPNSKIVRSKHELIHFDKVFIKKNESKIIPLQIPLSKLRYYNTKQQNWDLEDANYVISVGPSLKEQPFHQSIHITGNKQPYSSIQKDMFHINHGILHVEDEDYIKILQHPLPKKRKAFPFTSDTTIAELQEKKLGKVIYEIVKKIAQTGFVEGMDESVLNDTCIRQMIWLDGVNWNTVELGVSYMNKHHFKVLKNLISSINQKQ